MAKAPEGKTLNQQNLPMLTVVGLANAVVFYLIATTGSLVLTGFAALFKEWNNALPAGGGAIIVGILTALFNENTKARLVFWRWRDPLPGCRAFSEYAPRDPRFTMDQLKKAININTDLPTDPHEQNALWYKLYAPMQNQDVIRDSHRNFLFYRDYATISVLLLIAFGAVGFWYIRSELIYAVYVVGLVAQYLLVQQAAKNYGIGFVTNVLARVVNPPPPAAAQPKAP
jgi:hypothetical protein